MPGSKSLAGRGFGAERGLLPRNPFCVWTQTPTPCRYEVRDGVLRLKPTLTEHIMEELYTAGEDRVRPPRPPSQRCLLLLFYYKHSSSQGNGDSRTFQAYVFKKRLPKDPLTCRWYCMRRTAGSRL